MEQIKTTVSSKPSNQSTSEKNLGSKKKGDYIISHNYQKFFEICSSCKGDGHIIIQKIVDIVEETCPKCKGSGHMTKPCKNCEGKGCKTCKGTGIYVYRQTFRHPGKTCFTCSGSGKIRKPVLSQEEAKQCSKCKGTGKVEVPFNPVLLNSVMNNLFIKRN